MALIHVVEDDLALAAFLQEALEDEGYRVLVARNGATALEQLATTRPDLLLCDLMMPVMDGVTFCHHVQSIPTIATIPIVLCSAGKADVVDGRCQYAAFLRKPFQLRELLATVTRVLGR